jgi:hypothetical protein
MLGGRVEKEKGAIKKNPAIDAAHINSKNAASRFATI